MPKVHLNAADKMYSINYWAISWAVTELHNFIPICSDSMGFLTNTCSKFNALFRQQFGKTTML